MKHHYQTTLLFLLFTTAALAQTFKPISHWRAGGSGHDAISDIAFDAAGNQYIVGGFNGTVDFDPGSGVNNLSTPVGYTQSDGYVLKLDVNGNFLWAKSFGGTTDGEQYVVEVDIDNSGNIILRGFYKSNIRFEPNGTLWSTTAANMSSPFIAKFNSSGVLQWGYGWATGNGGYIPHVVIDNSDNIYAVGYFLNSFDFNPLPGSSNTNIKTSSGSTDMFLMKLTSSGTIQSVYTLGSTGQDYMGSLAFDGNDKLYISGSFSSTVDFNFKSGVSNLTSINAMDGFVMKIDTALNFIWAKSFGGQGDVLSRSMAFKNNFIYNAGSFTLTTDLDPGTTTNTATSNGSNDCFLQKLDTNANLIWSATFGGTGRDDITRSIATVSNESILSGFFENTVDFDPSPTADNYIPSNGGRDGFILKLDSLGNFKNVGTYGSNTVPFQTEAIYALGSSSQIPLAAGGNFFNTIDINPSSLVTQNATSAGQDDMLYLRLESCTNALAQSTTTACGSSYQLPSGNMVFASGYYLDTVLSTQGCDSTNGITVTLNPLPNTTVIQTGATFTAQPGLTYQWLNCQTNQPIAGETNQTFTATANGQYAVIVSNGTCTDTSVCYSITNIGLHEAHLPAVSMYPNPTTGLLNISSPQPWQKAEVTDLLGRQLWPPQTPPKEGAASGYTSSVDLSHLPTGIYLVKVFFAEGVVVQRVVKR